MRVRDMLYTHDIFYEFRRGVFWKKFFHYLKSKHTLPNFGQSRNTFLSSRGKELFIMPYFSNLSFLLSIISNSFAVLLKYKHKLKKLPQL